MSKLVRGQVPYHATYQIYQFDEMTHLPLSKKLQIIQSQGKLEAIPEESESPVQMITFSGITPSDITLKICLSLQNSQLNDPNQQSHA